MSLSPGTPNCPKILVMVSSLQKARPGLHAAKPSRSLFDPNRPIEKQNAKGSGSVPSARRREEKETNSPKRGNAVEKEAKLFCGAGQNCGEWRRIEAHARKNDDIFSCELFRPSVKRLDREKLSKEAVGSQVHFYRPGTEELWS
jgi:hypothetical protein